MSKNLSASPHERIALVVSICSSFATVCLAASTLGLMLYASRQDSKLGSALKILTRQEAALGSALEILTRQEAAVERANIRSEENFQQEMRAYVVETGITLDHNADTHLKAAVNLENMGRTPAYKLAFYGRTSFLKFGTDFNLPYVYPEFCGQEPMGQESLAANGVAPFSTLTTDVSGNEIDAFKPSDLDEIKKGHAVFVVWGIACYVDIFAKSHFKQFCRYYTTQDGLLKNLSRACAANNEFDLPDVQPPTASIQSQDQK